MGAACNDLRLGGGKEIGTANPSRDNDSARRMCHPLGFRPCGVYAGKGRQLPAPPTGARKSKVGKSPRFGAAGRGAARETPVRRENGRQLDSTRATLHFPRASAAPARPERRGPSPKNVPGPWSHFSSCTTQECSEWLTGEIGKYAYFESLKSQHYPQRKIEIWEGWHEFRVS